MSSEDVTPVEKNKKGAKPEPAPEPALVDAEKKTVEELALARGLLPMWIPGKPIRVNQLGVIREITPPPTLNTAHWKFAAAKALRNWPEGAEVTAEQFEKAVDEAANMRIG